MTKNDTPFADWYAAQHAFVAERERANAEQCRCGHSRGSHMDDVASCCSCRNCFSFRKGDDNGHRS